MLLGTSDPAIVEQAWSLLQLVVVAAMAGWVAERVLDTGVQSRGLPFLSGLFGLYVGPHLLGLIGWPSGPVIGGQPGDVLLVLTGADVHFHGLIGRIDEGWAVATDHGSLLPVPTTIH